MFGKRKANQNGADAYEPYDEGLPYGEADYGPEYDMPEYDPDDRMQEGANPEYGGYDDGMYAEQPSYDDGYTDQGYDEETDPDDNAGPEGKVYPRSIFRPETRKPNFVLSVLVNTVRVLLVLVLLIGVAGIGAVLGIAKGYVDTAPELDLVTIQSTGQNSTFYDRNRNKITEYRGSENREIVSFNAIPRQLRNAFVAVEDERFYSHNGIDLKSIGRALVSNMNQSRTQGGSTITQQLIKNTLLSPEQSYKRKIQEAYLAIQLENKYTEDLLGRSFRTEEEKSALFKRYGDDQFTGLSDTRSRLKRSEAKRVTKNMILESYLNTIYLGENYYGVKVAARGYFNKELKDLTLRECAMLAGLTNNPYKYNPRKNYYPEGGLTPGDKTNTDVRTEYVLQKMYENQFITREEYEAALRDTASVLAADPDANAGALYDYPHYIEYAVKETVQILLKLNGLENTAQNRTAMENKLRTGGYQIQLAIDTEIQQNVESTLQNWTQYPSLRDPADKVFRSKNADGTYTDIVEPQAGCAVLDYRTGELLAIVGSRTEVTARKTLNRATDMKMPVGSSIKPIAVYAPALDLGQSPASIVYNMPIPIPGWRDTKGKDSWPTNYGGGGYKGPETLRQAMMKSNNTSAAQALMTWVGIDRSVDYLHRMGIDDDHIEATPFGLSLGASGITPLQMTVAFGVLANGGIYQTPISVLGISDADGNVVWDGHNHQDRYRVFSDSTAFMIVDMLKSAVKNGTGTTAQIKGQTVGGKTGTNSDQKGVFFAGFTGYYSSAIWVGHDNYKALASKSTGSGAAAPLWQAYMAKIHKNLPDKDILSGSYEEYGLTKVTTCGVSGKLATDACRNDSNGYKVVTDYWKKGTAPTEYCDMHTMQTVCMESGMPASPFCSYTEQKGVIVIPPTNRLYQLIGTQYQSVLEQYLGSAAAYSGQVCTLHSAANPGTQGGIPGVSNQYIADARQMIAEAERRLATLDPASEQYSAVVNAAQYLQSLIDSGAATEADITAAMTALTRAMAGIY